MSRAEKIAEKVVESIEGAVFASRLGVFEFKKKSSPERSHGRGSDNWKIPAKYDILYKGERVGFAYGSRTGMYEKTTWDLVAVDGFRKTPARTFFNGGLGALKSWVENKFYDWLVDEGILEV